MSADVKLKNEKEVPMFEYNSAVQELVKLAKAEKDNLEQQIVLAKSRLSQTRQEIIRKEGEFNQWKMGEEQKFKNELSKRHNQLVDQENKMNIFHKDLEQRRADLLVKEERYLKVEEEKNAIGNTRVEVERIRVNANNLMAEADRKLSEAKSAMVQANIRIEQSNKLDIKNVTKNQELAAREDKLAFDLKNLEMERNHLAELKEFVEPKIVEIKDMEENIQNARKEIEIKHQEVINKTEENKIIMKALEDKKALLDKRENEIKSKEEELRRKILIHETSK